MRNDTKLALTEALSAAISDRDSDAAAAVARMLGGCECSISTDDGEPEALTDGDDTLWVVSEHRLLIDGEPVAEWTRCARGDWGEMGRQCSEDEWCVSEDTEGGDCLPDTVAAVLDVLGLEDDLPDVPAPALATDEHEESEDGEYAVYWETYLEDAGPSARYDSLEAAQAVCDQRNREFSARNPSGGGTTMLCGYAVRQLIDGEWCAIEHG